MYHAIGANCDLSANINTFKHDIHPFEAYGKSLGGNLPFVCFQPPCVILALFELSILIFNGDIRVKDNFYIAHLQLNVVQHHQHYLQQILPNIQLIHQQVNLHHILHHLQMYQVFIQLVIQVQHLLLHNHYQAQLHVILHHCQVLIIKLSINCTKSCITKVTNITNSYTFKFTKFISKYCTE